MKSTNMMAQKSSKAIVLFALAVVVQSALGQVIPPLESPEQVTARLRKEAAERNRVTMELKTRFKTPEVIRLADDRSAVLDHFERLPSRPGAPEADQYLPVYVSGFNVIAAQTTRTDRITFAAGTKYKFTGAGVRIGIWDEAHVEFTHPEFAGASLGTLGPNFPTTVNIIGHANHVAGTMVGRGANLSARGMATAAKVLSGTYYSGTIGGNTYAGPQVELAANASTLQVSNHSYGPRLGWAQGRILINNVPTVVWIWWGGGTMTDEARFGAYELEDQSYDSIARANPFHLIVKAAGNDFKQGPAAGTSHYYVSGSGLFGPVTTVRSVDGNPNGYDSLAATSVGKNILTVGSINDLPNYTGPASVVHSLWGNQVNHGGSGAGPTDDGRIKPDVVGNGYDLFSAVLNNGYGFMQGTSMSSPNVAGTAALLVQQWSAPGLPKPGQPNVPKKVNSSFLKGLLIHTAREAGNTGPDYLYGWGLINAEAAAQFANHRLPSAVLPAKWTADTGFALVNLKPNGSYKLKLPCAVPSQDIKVTIVWLDPAGPIQPTGVVDPNVKQLVNDLDLKVVGGPGNATFLPWVLNPSAPSVPATKGINIRDNVEQVVISAAAAGSYEIQISHSGTLFMNQDQQFCVLWTNLRQSFDATNPSIKP